MAKFSPGPWEAEESEYSIVITGQVSGRYQSIAAAWTAAILTGDDLPARANGALIAAAPEMYEALNVALTALESIEAKTLAGHEGCIWPAEIVRAALAKANGGR